MTTPKTSSYWDKSTILSRIADSENRIRYEAGSPNQTEVELYYHSIMSGSASNAVSKKRVLVLGMTPEIRYMALSKEFTVISIDHNLDVIDMYKDWVPDEYKKNEKIIHGSWWDIEKYLTEPVDVVLGDGVFGNILSVGKHCELLRILKAVLADNGIMIFRKALLPDGFDTNAYEADALIHKYRSGVLSDAEFGFSMRLWGNYKNAYNPQTFILENGITFQRYQAWAKEGILSEAEYACIGHYYFEGLNMILPQFIWEEILSSSGCSFKHFQLKGKDWYAYYPIYRCHF